MFSTKLSLMQKCYISLIEYFFSSSQIYAHRTYMHRCTDPPAFDPYFFFTTVRPRHVAVESKMNKVRNQELYEALYTHGQNE